MKYAHDRPKGAQLELDRLFRNNGWHADKGVPHRQQPHQKGLRPVIGTRVRSQKGQKEGQLKNEKEWDSASGKRKAATGRRKEGKEGARLEEGRYIQTTKKAKRGEKR